MYLLDTNVISEMRKFEGARATSSVLRWTKTVQERDQYLSSITVMELQTGALRLLRKDPEQADVLRRWLHDYVLPSFSERILVVDTDVALRCATLQVPKTPEYRDSFIGATALVHGLTVVTRNVKDFLPMGCKVLNPWEG